MTIYKKKSFLISYLLCLIVLFPFPLEAQTTSLKICQKGIEKCKPLVKDKEKYKRCMTLVCADEKPEELSKTTKIPTNSVRKKAETCETGKKRCEPLKKEVEFYWECMDETCSDPTLKNVNPSCPEGHNACKPELDEYKACVKLNCGSAEECPRSKSLCNDGLTRYWQCVYRVCLGPVDYFRKKASKIEKYAIIEDKKGRKSKIIVNKTPETLTGAWPAYIVAPKGVDPEEWIRDMPSKFMITGNPSKYMRCYDTSAIMNCSTRDLRSCACSDGTPPIMINGIPKPYKN